MSESPSKARQPRWHPCTTLPAAISPEHAGWWVPLSTARTTHDGRPRNPRLVAGVEGHGRFYAGVLEELYGSHRPHTLYRFTIARCTVHMSDMSSCAISVHVLRCLQARRALCCP